VNKTQAPQPLPGARRAEAPLFIAMRATDPLQDLLYFVCDGKPHEATGIHRTCRQQCSRMAARGAQQQAMSWAHSGVSPTSEF